ncbi:LysM peptidoglycan-binding domain-containing protein [Cryobacterium sp. SO1]|uniref:muramidase family protein n=1 Tax=Cryobacterium sp. SO1 TaxID=1897061 RepID=UPI0010F214F7|nr:LysM peptidoglycan-binding domain-containing protein [Cryobacterium sp. SO1]RZI34015.1 N-acetylmuramoyl-L-alanine amidase sle1 [Cryobacterium sp. SO1]
MSVRASKIETGTVRQDSPVETTGSPATSSASTPSSARHRPATTGVRRSIGAFASIPLVVVSTIAIVLNLASPAQAATALKKPLKSRTTLPQAMPKPVQVVQPATSTPAPSQYTVVDGDTISAIAGKFGLSTASVLALNGLGWSAVIFPGQVLTLSTTPLAVAATPASVATELTRYTIQSGDTLSGVAAAHGVPTDALFSVNGLGSNSIIFPGQVIVLPAAGSATATATASTTVATVAATATTTSTPGSHTVVAGDTLDKVATGAGVSVQAVLEANGLGYSSIIYPGQVLALPSAASAGTASAGSAPVLDAAPAVVITPTPTPAQGAVTPLTAEMTANAKLIIAVGRQAGANDAALVVALAAAAQESGLRNVDYGDRDSLGLFQQRPSSGWGNEAQVMDAERSTRAFFGGAVNPNPGVTRGLLDIEGWEAMTLTQAAQAVQISGHPDLYAKWETSARSWLADLG